MMHCSVRALEAVGEQATVFHMNEGHSAFLALERTRKVREMHGVTFDQAREATAAGHIFTTHTPVPAGIDRFAPSMLAHQKLLDQNPCGLHPGNPDPSRSVFRNRI